MKLRFLLSALTVLSLVSCGKKEESASQPKPLVVGCELSYPPFEMTDAQGQPSGIGVELAQAIARALGREIVIKNYKFDGLIPALKNGELDFVISSMTITEERKKSINFSDPYLTTGLAILTTPTSGVSDASGLEKPGLKVAVKLGTTGHTYALEHLKQAQVLVFEEDSACALEVSQGKADVFIYDQMSIYQEWLKHKETTRALLTPFQRESWGIGLRKGNDVLRTQINGFLKGFKASGGFRLIGEKYITDKSAFGDMGYPFDQ
jgi:polar amino acid transport system substrate-binding protein